MALSTMARIPSGSAAYGPTLATRPMGRTAHQAAIPPGYACELHAYDAKQLFGDVYGHGYNHCSVGLLMKSQVCIYKLHHILFFSDWRKEKCQPAALGVPDRPPAFRALSVSRTCRAGKGNWVAVTLGSNELRPGLTWNGAVKSEHEARICN
jgi:hypothetical protein